MKTTIFVNPHIITANQDRGRNDPPIIVRSNSGDTYGHEVEVQGPCAFVYRPDQPLSSGARLWVETTSPVKVHNAATGEVSVIEPGPHRAPTGTDR